MYNIFTPGKRRVLTNGLDEKNKNIRLNVQHEHILFSQCALDHLQLIRLPVKRLTMGDQHSSPCAIIHPAYAENQTNT